MQKVKKESLISTNLGILLEGLGRIRRNANQNSRPNMEPLQYETGVIIIGRIEGVELHIHVPI